MSEVPFPHLRFVGVEFDRARLHSGGESSAQTITNKQNRVAHSEHLRKQLANLNAWWGEQKKLRGEQGAPEIKGIPLWVKIDPSEQNADFLRGFGFQIVAEEEDGFVLLAADEQTFTIAGQKLDAFREALPRKDKPASIYEIAQQETEEDRIKRVLPAGLWDSWRTLDDAKPLVADLSISCDLGQPSDFKPQGEGESDEHYQLRLQRRELRIKTLQRELDELKLNREQQIEAYITAYKGQILDCYDGSKGIDFPDSFTIRVQICGQGFKDIVRTFPYLFQVEEIEDVLNDGADLGAAQDSVVEVLPPSVEAPSACIIDSGIQEDHKFLGFGIKADHSYNFIPGQSPSDTADYVKFVGHGTQVAGGVLFPNEIPIEGKYQLAGYVQNARILDVNNKLSELNQPAAYIQQITQHYNSKYRTRIFNHSINAAIPFRTPHMSTWAAAIDKVSYENDILIVQSGGNIQSRNPNLVQMGVENHLQAGRKYPDYLYEPSSKLANPAQSFQALTVGAIGASDYSDESRVSIGGAEKCSAFSRTGLGIWDSIKPEVVEIGGDLLQTTSPPFQVSEHPGVAPLLIQSTLYGRNALGTCSVGTSYAAPRIAALALDLQRMLPEETALLYRALIANSARWPRWAEEATDKYSVMRQIGYGRPDPLRALENDPYRVTLVISGETLSAREAKMFRVPVPAKLRSPGSEFDVRIDITLSYAAMPRRTRQGHRQYLSCRLDWKCSKKGEPEGAFRRSLFADIESDSIKYEYLPWMLRNDDYGQIPEVRRNHGTLQKDWAIVKGRDLPEDFLIGVVGHPGWDKANQYPAKFALAVSFEAVNRDIEIYEEVRVLLDNIRVQENKVSIRLDEINPNDQVGDI